MNYLQARRRDDGSGWHMTVRNDDDVWPHTCCRTQVPATQEDVERLDWIYHGKLKVGDLISGQAHDPHPTKEAAEDCYNDWRLKQIHETIEFSDAIFGDWTGCQAKLGDDHGICDAPTKGGARYNDGHAEHVALCEDHRTVENVLSEFERVTWSAYS